MSHPALLNDPEAIYLMLLCAWVLLQHQRLARRQRYRQPREAQANASLIGEEHGARGLARAAQFGGSHANTMPTFHCLVDALQHNYRNPAQRCPKPSVRITLG